MTSSRPLVLPSLTVQSVSEKQAKVKNFMLQTKLDKAIGLLQSEEQIYLQLFRKEKHIVEVAKSKILLRSQISNNPSIYGETLLSPISNGKGTAGNTTIPRSQSMPDTRQLMNKDSKRLLRLDSRPVQRLMEVPDVSRRKLSVGTIRNCAAGGNNGNVVFKQSKSVNVDSSIKPLSVGINVGSINRPHFCPPSPRQIFSCNDRNAIKIELPPMQSESIDVDAIAVNPEQDGRDPIVSNRIPSLKFNNLLSSSCYRTTPRPTSASYEHFRSNAEITNSENSRTLRSQSATVLVGGGMRRTENETALSKVNHSNHPGEECVDFTRVNHGCYGRMETKMTTDEEEYGTLLIGPGNDELEGDEGYANRRKPSLKRRRESVFPASVQHLKNELRDMADERAQQLKKRFDFDKAIAREKQGFKDVVKRVDEFFVQMHHSGMLQHFMK